MPAPDAPLRFPQAEPPPLGEPFEIAPGILWLRLPLPYALDHVNIYLLEDDDGWALFDAGICDEPTKELWSRLIGSTFAGRRLTRFIISHFHPDHAGMTGWLHERFGAPLLMPRTDYLFSRLLQTAPTGSRPEEPEFYRMLGLDSGTIHSILNRGKKYLERMSGLPSTYYRLLDGEMLTIGGRIWHIMTGGGHAPEQAMLWCKADRLFLAADQVLARISPNVSVAEIEPAADPLKLYLESLQRIDDTIEDDVLVLPGHNLPFFGLQKRVRQLGHHHGQRCQKIADACVERALSAAEIVPILFARAMDPHQLGFALGETLAHLNYMARRDELARTIDSDAVTARYRTVS